MKRSPAAVRDVIRAVMRPAHFFVGPSLDLVWKHVTDESVPWEIFRGRLLDGNQTRLQQTFEAWNVHVVTESESSSEPLLSIKLSCSTGEVHVVRGVLCHVWEGYDSGDNVYLSRETTRWMCEFVGSLMLAEIQETETLRAELANLLFRAIVGASRLPLTSVEAPLPDFSLGALAYFHRQDCPRSEAMRSSVALIQEGLHGSASWLQKTKLLEAMLRAVAWDELPAVADRFARRWREIGHHNHELPALLRSLFNEVSLSPWTEFVDKTLAFVRMLVDAGHLDIEARIDFLSSLLRQLGRHLTAYDLVTFHHRGANYPDALLLDVALKDYLKLIESHAELFLDGGRLLRRRALRQGWFMRRHYEGLPVPDAPTSPGENSRVLPPPHVRVPEEQILQPTKRRRFLYDHDPLDAHVGERGRQVLAESLRDLQSPSELRELGMAVFIDRPLGVHKEVGEPDQTPLLSYEAFSRSIAHNRLEQLGRLLLLEPGLRARCEHQLRELQIDGLPVTLLPEETRPVASLSDARKVAADFLLLRTTPSSARAFLKEVHFDCAKTGEPLLIVRGHPAGADPEPRLTFYDASFRPIAAFLIRSS
jgi:hypothetical protein